MDFLNLQIVIAAVQLFKLVEKYRPETRVAKINRLKLAAQAKADGKEVPPFRKQHQIKSGSNTVTKLVEQKKAQLVLIAHDVDPIEVSIIFVDSNLFDLEMRKRISSPEGKSLVLVVLRRHNSKICWHC
jgi:Ribosomal protein L7Ae/L30e/S12e/Gadd45 family